MNAHYLLPSSTTCYLLLATCYLLLATYHLLLATCYLLRTYRSPRRHKPSPLQDRLPGGGAAPRRRNPCACRAEAPRTAWRHSRVQARRAASAPMRRGNGAARTSACWLSGGLLSAPERAPDRAPDRASGQLQAAPSVGQYRQSAAWAASPLAGHAGLLLHAASAQSPSRPSTPNQARQAA